MALATLLGRVHAAGRMALGHKGRFSHKKAQKAHKRVLM